MNFIKDTTPNLTIEDICLTIQANPEAMKQLTIETMERYADVIKENNSYEY